MDQKKVEEISQQLGGKNLVIVAEGDYLFYSGTIAKTEVAAMLKTILLDLQLEEISNAEG